MKNTAHYLEYRITQLKLDKMLYVLESIAVVVLTLFTTALLPQLLFKYVYSAQNLTEAPVVFDYIPLIAFVVGMGFALFVVVTNVMRFMKIKELDAQLTAMLSGESCACDGGLCACDGGSCCKEVDSCECGGGCQDGKCEMEKKEVVAKPVAKKKATKK